MSAAERAEWEAFKAEKAKKEAAELRKQQRETYQELVNDELAAAIPELRALSEQIKTTKDTLFSNFRTVLDMKADVVGFKEDGQYSHTFTNTDSSLRLTLGVNTVDGWTDMAETGIGMVRRYLESLATDDKSKALVNAVMRLLSKDRQGNLNASKVLQLQKMAEESEDDQFIEAVKIIRESYQPTETRRYIRAQYRDESTGNAWRNIPLSITDVDLLPVSEQQQALPAELEAEAGE
ncbi:MAG: DUF3164 family protein [Bacteroides sp.]|nr:DUF3164 family protein [Bacteroidales bacterium]MBD5301615.1 DUF3164 family protein [Bacteroides sp.]